MTDVMDPGVADDVISQDDNQQQEVVSPEIEALAREVGWKPADEWKGEGHMPARDFLKHQADRAKLKSEELRSLNKRMDRLARTSDTVMARQLQEQREELEGKYADLVAANKPNEARRVSQQIDNLTAADSSEDIVRDFEQRNASWYGVDEAASALAVGICDKNKNLPFDQQLEKAEAAVKKAFPHLFGEPAARPKPPVVGAPVSRSAPARARGFTAETLPPEAKKALAGFLSRIPDQAKHAGFTKSYLADYNKENGQ